jgi:hypothetical protein
MFALNTMSTVPTAASIAGENSGGGHSGLIIILILALSVVVVFSVLSKLSQNVAIVQDPIRFFFRAVMFGVTASAVVAAGVLYLVYTAQGSFLT